MFGNFLASRSFSHQESNQSGGSDNSTLYSSYTVWHDNFTVIKFYGFAILCRERKLTDFNFTEPWLIK